MSKTAVHFYLTFNPYLNTEYEHEYTQAHEFHDLLKQSITKNKKSTCFWGKIIGKDRTSTVEFEKFSTIIQNNHELGISTHLYITDFQNLWVCKVNAVTDKLPKKAITLPFYEGKNVEIWFEISDMTLLEHNHEETANKLSELYIDNPYMKLTINGLSPFTTGIKYPCFIQDLAEEHYFDEFETSEYSHLILKPNPSITSNSTQQVLRSIYTYSIHETMYSKLPHAAKVEIESAELDMYEQKHHNVGRITFAYLKALEVILNDLVIGHIKRSGHGENFFVDATSAPPKLYLQESKDYYIPLKQFNKNFSINQIIYFIERCHNQSHLSFKKAFSEQKQFVRFVTGDLQKLIKENNFVPIRNALAHNDSDKVDIHDAMAIRYLILGVGCKGIINQLYQTFYPEKFRDLIKVKGQYESNTCQAKLKLVG
jgi:hypothetical protein